MTEVRIDNGIDMAMMIVLRQLPRNRRIIRPVNTAAITASRITPVTDPRTKIDWSPIGVIFSAGGSVSCTRGSSFRMPLTTLSVDAVPDFRITISAARRPSCLTIFVCGMLPSVTEATSCR